MCFWLSLSARIPAPTIQERHCQFWIDSTISLICFETLNETKKLNNHLGDDLIVSLTAMMIALTLTRVQQSQTLNNQPN
jgi:hypothetical protein